MPQTVCGVLPTASSAIAWSRMGSIMSVWPLANRMAASSMTGAASDAEIAGRPITVSAPSRKAALAPMMSGSTEEFSDSAGVSVLLAPLSAVLSAVLSATLAVEAWGLVCASAVSGRGILVFRNWLGGPGIVLPLNGSGLTNSDDISDSI